MSNRGKSSTLGIGFVGLFTISFIILKLTGDIDWSWWQILAPLWIILVTVVSILLIVCLSDLVDYIIDEYDKK